EFPVGAQVRATILKSVAGLFEFLKAVVEWHDARDFVPHSPTVLASQQMRAVRSGGSREFAQDFPFGARLAHLTGDFRAESDAAFRDRFRPAVVLFVPRFGREQDYLLFGLDEHLIRENDVLVHAYGYVRERLADVFRIRQRAQEISTET